MDVFEKAHKMVADLCHGTRDWIMSIPADEERDPDLVISAAIRAGIKAQATADRQRELLSEWNKIRVEKTHEDCPFCGMSVYAKTTPPPNTEILFEDRHTADCKLAKELADE